MRNFGKTLIVAALAALAATSALAFDRDNNPPGPVGGPGTNWENPPGPRGGPGASPDIRANHRYLMRHMSRGEWIAFRRMRAAERHEFCHRRHIPMDHCWYDRNDFPRGPHGHGPGHDWH
jgi:hypothetical protein